MSLLQVKHPVGALAELPEDEGAPAHGENGTYSARMYVNEATRIIAEHPKDKPLFLFQAFHNVRARLRRKFEPRRPLLELLEHQMKPLLIFGVSTQIITLLIVTQELEITCMVLEHIVGSSPPCVTFARGLQAKEGVDSKLNAMTPQKPAITTHLSLK